MLTEANIKKTLYHPEMLPDAAVHNIPAHSEIATPLLDLRQFSPLLLVLSAVAVDRLDTVDMRFKVDNSPAGQTWGPCLGIAADGGGIGAGANERAVYFQEDGAIGIITDGSITNLNQYAGFMLQNTTPGDSLFYMLQLAP